jgi:hypothetical protein
MFQNPSFFGLFLVSCKTGFTLLGAPTPLAQRQDGINLMLHLQSLRPIQTHLDHFFSKKHDLFDHAY